MIDALKALVKACIRTLVYARLARLPLSESAAVRWAGVMKRWPAIFAAEPFRKRVAIGDGLVVQVGLIDVIERTLFLTGAWDRPVLDRLKSELRAGATFLDVGANIGYFSLKAARWVGPTGRVLAIEPTNANLSRLAFHAWDNRVENLLIASIAAGDRAATPSIHFPTQNNAGGASLRDIRSIQGHVVLQFALDDLLDLQRIEPDVIKLDVEGFELEALKGLRRTLERKASTIVCEVTDDFLRQLGQSADELLAFMDGVGYSCRSLSDARGIRAGDEIRPGALDLSGIQFDAIFVPAAMAGSRREGELIDAA